ncbi:MAG: type I methionyl aminopeptidase [Candidatus Edwardsbacteria bacterium]|nr:type I methionyl aminopeptidase [Candidatus Edwardsbacteria bacterium]
MIPVYSALEIEKLKISGRIIAEFWEALKPMVGPGALASDLDAFAEKFIAARGGTPAFKGYRGYPAALCVSLNHEVVHGIPGPDRILKDGDLVGIDVGVAKDGFITDAARSYHVGQAPSLKAIKLLAVGRQALEDGIAQARAGALVRDVSRAIQEKAESAGFSVVREMCGHGVGGKLHQEPEVPNYVRIEPSPRLKPGMCLAIEPMINAGGHRIKFLSDGWTVVTADGSSSVHFEDTVVVTVGAPLVLTRL